MWTFFAGVAVGEVVTLLLVYMGHNWYLMRNGGR
ncbi:hypothetical protein J2Y02_001769 [Neobacillus drentensis]|nr:hypothetical protein [Neobacillus drentensis]